MNSIVDLSHRAIRSRVHSELIKKRQARERERDFGTFEKFVNATVNADKPPVVLRDVALSSVRFYL